MDSRCDRSCGLNNSDPVARLVQFSKKLHAQGPGKVALGKVNADANPQLVQAFQAKSVPLVVALVAGRPVQLFQGEAAEPQIVK